MIHRYLTSTGLIALALSGASAGADEVTTRGQLDTLLGDKLVLEDFEGISVHGGSSFTLPNPMDTDTTPAWMGFQPGLLYHSPGGTLSVLGTVWGGQETVVLRATEGLRFAFDERQVAIGWRLPNPGINNTYTVRFVRNAQTVGQVLRGDGSGGFVGWFDPLGIDAVEITTASPPILAGGLSIDDLAFGWVVSNCPADLSGSSDPQSPAYGVPDGVVDASDFFYFLERFADGDQDVTDLTGSNNPTSPSYGVPDGAIDASDFFYYLDLFAHGCL